MNIFQKVGDFFVNNCWFSSFSKPKYWGQIVQLFLLVILLKYIAFMLFLITYYPIYLLQNTLIFLFLFSVNGAFNPLLWHVEEIHIVWNDYSCDHNHNDSGNAMHKKFSQSCQLLQLKLIMYLCYNRVYLKLDILVRHFSTQVPYQTVQPIQQPTTDFGPDWLCVQQAKQKHFLAFFIVLL